MRRRQAQPNRLVNAPGSARVVITPEEKPSFSIADAGRTVMTGAIEPARRQQPQRPDYLERIDCVSGVGASATSVCSSKQTPDVKSTRIPRCMRSGNPILFSVAMAMETIW